MKYLFNKYTGITLTVIVSFGVPSLLAWNNFLTTLSSVPGIAALAVMVYRFWRDQQMHDRAIELQNKQQDFILGTASHMAEVAYDKHVLFCEEYIQQVQKGFQELLRDGPSKNALEIGRSLVEIRQKHSPWLTKTIEENLMPFEKVLIKIGAQEGYLERVSGSTKDDDRVKVVIEEVYKSFGLVLGHAKPSCKEEEGLAIEEVIEKIRDILGINTMTKMRLKAAELALDRLKCQ